MNFGEIDNILLLGGGNIFAKTSLFLEKINLHANIIISNSQKDEIVDDKNKLTLEQFLNRNNKQYYISNDINKDPLIRDMINDNTLGFSINARWLIKNNFIDLLQGRIVNIHGANLPKHRGGGGYSWRIMSDDRTAGVCIHLIDSGIDTGDILLNKDYEFSKDYSKPIDYYKFAEKKMEALIQTFFNKIINKDNFTSIKQDNDKSSYWPRLSTDKNAFINWGWSVKEIHRFICAFDDPYGGCKTYINDELVHIKSSSIYSTEMEHHPYQAGIIIRKNSKGYFVAIKDGMLLVSNIVGNNKKSVKVRIGDRLFTPRRVLDQGMAKRIIYKP